MDLERQFFLNKVLEVWFMQRSWLQGSCKCSIQNMKQEYNNCIFDNGFQTPDFTLAQIQVE